MFFSKSQYFLNLANYTLFVLVIKFINRQTVGTLCTKLQNLVLNLILYIFFIKTF